LIVSDCDKTQWDALTALAARFPIHESWWTCTIPSGQAGQSLVKSLQAQNTPPRVVSSAERLLLDQEISIEVLDASDAGSALLLTWKNFRALLPGSFRVNDFPAEKVNTPGLLVLDGSHLVEDTTGGFLALQPEAAVLTAPSDPAMEVPAEWVQVGLWEWLTVTTDGNVLWIEKGR
jgi:hypothetical protein